MKIIKRYSLNTNKLLIATDFISQLKMTLFIAAIVLISALSACKKFLDADTPKNQIPRDLIFKDEFTATAAITGIYDEMQNSVNFAGGGAVSTASMAGLTSDELITVYDYFPESNDFLLNSIKVQNSYIYTLWETMYKTIYQSNDVIEGVNNSADIDAEVKNQLIGEAMFTRAFAHFYLVSFFGNVPLILSTDYKENAKAQRTDASLVYGQIVKDLLAAKDLVSDNYVSTERVRPNKATVHAFLARVYLCLGKWTDAEENASSVINNVKYSLPPNLNDVFLKNSLETIWQLIPRNVNGNAQTNESYIFNPLMLATYYVLREETANSFEDGDKRKEEWIDYMVEQGDTLYYPTKYKQYDPNIPLTEYSMVFRLAEQYLIRAEARANNNDLIGAIADLDSIRNRAGVPLIHNVNSGISKTNLLSAIIHEKRLELLTEWGHRWFDLKRLKQLSWVLAPIKPDWNDDDSLYPIPLKELQDNPYLGDQNHGY